MGFGFGFDMFQIMFYLMFFLIMVTFVATLVKNISQWNKNNQSPRLTVPARIVAKRTNHTRHRHNGVNGHHHTSTSTSYFVTFEVDSGDRMELQMQGHEYGLLVEGDQGQLTFQGTRYLGFQRG